MAKYQKIVNVWDNSIDLSKLQPGQWVECGKGGERGIWCGIRSSGSHVAAWYHNAKGKNKANGGYHGYVRTLMTYARN